MGPTNPGRIPPPPRSWRETIRDAAVVMLGFALAWGLAAVVLGL